MRTPSRHVTIPLLIGTLASSMPCTCGAQSNLTNRALDTTISSESNVETPTSGMIGRIEVHWDPDQRRLPDIVVLVCDTNANVFFGEKSSSTNWAGEFVFKFSRERWLYYAEPNLFCGPIELRDSAGRKTPLLKPEVSAAESYPASYSFKGEQFKFMSRHSYGSLPFPNAITAPTGQLAKFQLGDYFEIKEPGEYKLTVWPKIYKRSVKDNDLCERIDVPPVTVTIKWAGEASK